MNIAELLDPPVFRKNVKVVVARLPEGALFGPPHDRQLESLQAHSKQFSVRFTQQQMDMFRHHHVANDIEVIKTMYGLQRIFKEISGLGRIQVRKAMVATERYEV
jgi:hypothetical protein